MNPLKAFKKHTGNDNALITQERFEKYISENFGCINCVHLDKSDIPLHEKRCTNEKALVTTLGRINGVEADKAWLRQDDINNHTRFEIARMKDVNSYFMCDHFEEIKK